MSLDNISKPAFWSNKYINHQFGWDLGYAAPSLVAYFNQLQQKKLKILVPGAGFGYEVSYLMNAGFKNVYLLDFAPEAIEVFKRNHPRFPKNQIIQEDFFEHNCTYDLIVEHVFFCSLSPQMREQYVDKSHSLLNEGGKIVGLLFNHVFDFTGPPFGGTAPEYKQLFEKKFTFQTFETATNSIKPRMGREYFFVFRKNI